MDGGFPPFFVARVTVGAGGFDAVLGGDAIARALLHRDRGKHPPRQSIEIVGRAGLLHNRLTINVSSVQRGDGRIRRDQSPMS